MIWITPPIIQAFLITLLVLLVVFYLWHKLHENEALKYEFITIITHKFRTPLTHTKWILDDMIKSESDSYRRENLVELQRSNEDLVKLVSALIELTDVHGSKKSSYKLEHINLIDLVKESFKAEDHSFKEKNISVSFDFSNTEIFVQADRSRMEFVFFAIFENARMYTPVGGNVAIAVTAKWRKVIMSVIDDGIGIDQRDMPHVATRFFRSKGATAMDTSGFGVNLYLSRSIVRRHRGKLEIFSAGLKTGSTFSITLPRVK